MKRKTAIVSDASIPPPAHPVKPKAPRAYRAHYLPEFQRWTVLDPANSMVLDHNGNLWRSYSRADAQAHARALTKQHPPTKGG